jgi:ADP-glucose pyrophosphorylase
MNVLDGKLYTGLPERTDNWEEMPWGWRGTHGSSIAEAANLSVPRKDVLGSIIGSHVTVGANSWIERSVISRYSEIYGKVINSLCFPGTTHQVLEGTTRVKRNIVGSGIEITNSIFIGGELQLGQLPAGIRDRIIYENMTGGISFDPL